MVKLKLHATRLLLMKYKSHPASLCHVRAQVRVRQTLPGRPPLKGKCWVVLATSKHASSQQHALGGSREARDAANATCSRGWSNTFDNSSTADVGLAPPPERGTQACKRERCQLIMFIERFVSAIVCTNEHHNFSLKYLAFRTHSLVA